MKDGNTTDSLSPPSWTWGGSEAGGSETHTEAASRTDFGDILDACETELPSRRWLILAARKR